MVALASMGVGRWRRSGIIPLKYETRNITVQEEINPDNGPQNISLVLNSKIIIKKNAPWMFIGTRKKKMESLIFSKPSRAEKIFGTVENNRLSVRLRKQNKNINSAEYSAKPFPWTTHPRNIYCIVHMNDMELFHSLPWTEIKINNFPPLKVFRGIFRSVIGGGREAFGLIPPVVAFNFFLRTRNIPWQEFLLRDSGAEWKENNRGILVVIGNNRCECRTGPSLPYSLDTSMGFLLKAHTQVALTFPP